MKKLLFIFTLLISVAAFAQNDKIYLHNGKTIEGTVVRVAEFTLIFKYANEDAEQTVGKYAVEKIVYGKSAREEKVTDKISVLSKDDWEKVVMLVDKSEVAGLTKVNEVKGKTAMINYRTAAGSSAKAEKDLKQKVAEVGCAFLLMTADKDADLSRHNGRGVGGKPSMKTAVAYKY